MGATSGVVDEYVPGGPPVGTPLSQLPTLAASSGATPTLQNNAAATFTTFSGNEFPAFDLADPIGSADRMMKAIFGGAPSDAVGAAVGVATGVPSAAIGTVQSLFDPQFWKTFGVYILGGIAVAGFVWIGINRLGGR